MKERGFEVADSKESMKTGVQYLYCNTHNITFYRVAYPTRSEDWMTIKAGESVAHDHTEAYGCIITLVIPAPH